jgi:hypothetical protein
MLAGVSYEEASQSVYGSGRPRLTTTRMLKTALSRFGRKPAARLIPLRGRSYRSLTRTSLLKVNVDGSHWHWIVWNGKQTFDPEKPDRKRYRATSYLPVE